jgi:hypothetical protein
MIRLIVVLGLVTAISLAGLGCGGGGGPGKNKDFDRPVSTETKK